MLSDDPKSLDSFRRRLRSWYAKHSRSLPWRGTTDPYRVWVSEIMLQQTTTQTVKGYFERFMTRFPTIVELAAAELDQVNRLWEGLGYYRRCAQMHRAAKEIVERFGGVFPNNDDAVRSLPGVGRYTAGAILSIAFDRRRPILEANTIRLHARLTGLKADPTQRAANEFLWDFAERILPSRDVGHFNQALMDLGSLVCTPKQPRCFECPVALFCEAAKLGLQESIPYPKAKEKKEERTEVAVLVRNKGKILVVRYPHGVRWAGLWDFPRAESTAESCEGIQNDFELSRRLSELSGRRFELGAVVKTIKHVVTRFKITLHFYEAKDLGPLRSKTETAPYETRRVTLNELQHLPLNSTARELVALIDIK